MTPQPSTNLVRKYRRWNELSQVELAEQAGVSRQTIANIEKGNYAPSVYLALTISKILGRSVEDIFDPREDD
ncbi:MAG TPA: helix-turn-helix transcriptional regulator [Candidatus Rothia avistercoris]|uniref:Helix-turn-helix transcriptional regulator n=1 Tax=Candidatus Rothia avistercoris TaxID=2840479 RepID=A0A9D2ZTN4_9MICC|nr:helix-turn-helix transcriptional regulator [Rothia nasimurium]HJD51609.1 helix-turn-helix transcriptional regulator [Candidatus Rothia avistercoris]